MTINTIIIPAIADGARFLPATLAMPPELLPVIDMPLIQYALDEAIATGARRLVIVLPPGKAAVREYVEQVCPPHCELVFVGCERGSGAGDAIAAAAGLVKDDVFGVILPEELIGIAQRCLPLMASALRGNDAHLVAIGPVPAGDGVAAVLTEEPVPEGGVATLSDIATGDDMPAGELSLAGRFILRRAIFDRLAQTRRDPQGRISLNEALKAEIAAGGVTGHRFAGPRYACATPAGMLQATLAIASTRADLWEGDEFAGPLEAVA